MVIVSLTSFPAAISYAVGAIRSILRGEVLPDKLILYVTLADFAPGEMPRELLDLQESEPRFEIRDYPRDIRSYRKLVPALKDFHDDVIVTVDDDVDYHPSMLRRLLELHAKYPDDIIAHRAKIILPSKPYRKWPKLRWYDFLIKSDRAGFNVIQTGVAGVLYPPHALKQEMIDPELFTRLAPTADDIYFWAAAVANGRRVRPVPFGLNKPRELGKPKSLSLKTLNFKTAQDRNLASLQAILKEFPEIAPRISQ
ncbi:MAG: glycosyltransferase [Muribaculaceae bacterium]|nr:glycosyltransferase [Muribaculaceae bacterium]